MLPAGINKLRSLRRSHTRYPLLRFNEAGFTLIEVLCVLVMIGLLSGVVVMNMPPRKSATLTQAEALAQNLNALSQDALISGDIRAFGLSQTEYALYNYNGEDFVSIATRNWSDKVRVKFSRNGQTVKLPETSLPAIIFEPTRISTVFDLELSDSKGIYTLSSTGDGRVLLSREN